MEDLPAAWQQEVSDLIGAQPRDDVLPGWYDMTTSLDVSAFH
jgi:hypothetical protein